jgi:hypothetical protein
LHSSHPEYLDGIRLFVLVGNGTFDGPATDDSLLDRSGRLVPEAPAALLMREG